MSYNELVVVVVPTFETKLADSYLGAGNALELRLVDQSALAASAFESPTIYCLCGFGYYRLSLLLRCLLAIFHPFDSLKLLVLLSHAS